MTIKEFKKLRPGDKIIYNGMILEVTETRTSIMSELGFGVRFSHNKQKIEPDYRFSYLYTGYFARCGIIEEMIKI